MANAKTNREEELRATMQIGEFRLQTWFDHRNAQVLFCGGPYGEHRLTLDTSTEGTARRLAHWDGYVEVAQKVAKRNAARAAAGDVRLAD